MKKVPVCERKTDTREERIVNIVPENFRLKFVLVGKGSIYAEINNITDSVNFSDNYSRILENVHPVQTVFTRNDFFLAVNIVFRIFEFVENVVEVEPVLVARYLDFSFTYPVTFAREAVEVNDYLMREFRIF